MKKLLSTTLVFIIAFSILVIPDTAQAKTYKGFKYKVNSQRITITGYTGKAKNLIIPSYINGKRVTKIAKNAFWHWKGRSFSEIIVPDTIENIGLHAFDGVKTKKVYFGKRVKDLGWFNVPSADKKDTLSCIKVSKYNSSYKAEKGVLYNKKKTSLVYYPPNKKGKTFKLPKTVTCIEEQSFYHNRNLTKIKFNKKLKSIKQYAFEGAKKLSSVTLPSSLKKVSSDAFSECNKLSTVSVKKNSNLKVLSGTFAHLPSLKSVTVAKLKSYGENSFSHNKKLKKVTIKSGVKKIPYGMFYKCPNLKSVTIPKSVSKIEDAAFGYKDYNTKYGNFTIKGYKGSAAEKYAYSNGFTFKEIDDKKEALTAYKKILQNHPKKYRHFSLIYLDNNDVPELVVYDNDITESYIYTYYDTAVKEIDFVALIEMVEHEFCYYEKTGVYKSSDWYDGGPTGGWYKVYYNKLENGKVKTLDIYCEIDVGYSSPSFYGNKNGKITEQEFNDYLNKYTNGQKLTSPKHYKNTKNNRDSIIK